MANHNMTFANCNSYLIALGGNQPSHLGDSLTTLRAALERLEHTAGPVRARSRFWRTPAMPTGAGPDYVNACVALDSALAPGDLLATLHRIEAELGRTRAKRWEARVIDLDLLAQGAAVLPDLDTLRHWMDLPTDQQSRIAPDQLILPHPRLHQRGFVLAPLAEIAPDWVHPATGKSVSTLLAHLPDAARAGLTPL